MRRQPSAPPKLPYSGERFVPELGGDIALEHLHRYSVACELAADAVVLDIACGEGYGSAMLANVARRVIGIDICADAVAHAGARYRQPNLRFAVGSCDRIPLATASLDLIVCFETIEHHDRHEAMMAEFRRVLRGSGTLIISSPDKMEYADVSSHANPYHVRELYRQEFEALLTSHFEHVTFAGQRIVYGSAIFFEDGAGPVRTFTLDAGAPAPTDGMPRPKYRLAVASKRELPVVANGLLEQPIADSEAVRTWTDAVQARDELISSLAPVVGERDAMRRSISWRLTRPLRALSSAAPALRRYFRR